MEVYWKIDWGLWTENRFDNGWNWTAVSFFGQAKCHYCTDNTLVEAVEPFGLPYIIFQKTSYTGSIPLHNSPCCFNNVDATTKKVTFLTKSDPRALGLTR